MFRTLAAVAALTLLVSWPARGDETSDLSASIDRLIQARLDSEGVARASAADDAEFLRRAYLDLHGVVPPATRTLEFLDSRDPDKRARLIDELLASPRFGENFGDVWRNYLVSPLANEQPTHADRFAEYLTERFNSDASWDEIAFELLTASGTLEENPAVAYLIEGRHPLGVNDLTDLTSRYFLGVQLNCAQCHDHPFVDLKQRDYWGMAAFFTEIQTPGRPKAVYRFGIQDDPQIVMATLDDEDIVDEFRSLPPTFLGGESADASDDETRRVALARWMTSPENPYFARATVNRTWWRLFGRGMVNPVDDMHAGNAPSHPELLDMLSQRFVESGFDLKFLYRAILNSRTYQQTSRTGDGADAQAELFGRASVKSLAPGQLYDSLVTILGPPRKTKGGGAVGNARDEFCRFFAGDGEPDPLRFERGIPHVLRLMNSPQFAGDDLASQVFRTAGSEDERIEQLYVTILSRRPATEERRLAREHLRDADDSPDSAYRELAWALLMSGEFMSIH